MILDSHKWDARYGWDLLAQYGPQYNSYIAVSSPSAWAAVERFFLEPPRHLEFQQGMNEQYLAALLPRLPHADLVLAIGGGNALDVGKYVAWKLKQPLILIPTIVSTGAVFQAPVAVRRANTWDFMETVAPEYVLFDLGVIRSAPPRLNCAGMGECICNLGAVGSWKWWVDQGYEGAPWDEAAADATVAWVRDRAARFSQDLDDNGQPNELGIRIAAEINRERYDLPTFKLNVSHSLDHVFCIAFQWVHGRELMHSESVALGSLINGYLYDWGFEETKALLDACQVRYRPRDISCTHAEVCEVLGRMNELNDMLGHAPNWFHHRELDDATFARMMAAIDADK